MYKVSSKTWTLIFICVLRIQQDFNPLLQHHAIVAGARVRIVQHRSCSSEPWNSQRATYASHYFLGEMFFVLSNWHLHVKRTTVLRLCVALIMRTIDHFFFARWSLCVSHFRIFENNNSCHVRTVICLFYFVVELSKTFSKQLFITLRICEWQFHLTYCVLCRFIHIPPKRKISISFIPLYDINFVVFTWKLLLKVQRSNYFYIFIISKVIFCPIFYVQ